MIANRTFVKGLLEVAIVVMLLSAVKAVVKRLPHLVDEPLYGGYPSRRRGEARKLGFSSSVLLIGSTQVQNKSRDNYRRGASRCKPSAMKRVYVPEPKAMKTHVPENWPAMAKNGMSPWTEEC